METGDELGKTAVARPGPSSCRWSASSAQAVGYMAKQSALILYPERRGVEAGPRAQIRAWCAHGRLARVQAIGAACEPAQVSVWVFAARPLWCSQRGLSIWPRAIRMKA